MSKIVQMILSGIFFTFILDFFLFLGIKENYIDAHGIKLYYNILFADNQNIFVFIIFTLIIGYVVMYLSNKTAIIIVSTLFLLSASTLIPPIGSFAGEILFMKKDITMRTDKFSYHGDILYSGRKKVTFYDHELKKVILLDKKTIQGSY
ncbi:hypothetical protein [Sulfurimonas paralvinellae]|uniref:Uncharacterized protein n=1 Tax=Sulfurimonas paralvinellae TaxID=317658 RepID=A0A7M1B9E9_9BACT|nr:hypothetical protein [Sulfurimonas paralvinellae]QOP46066.1 hypothetical protein FM071_07050 [Sulfurimonas paralvinellae]